MTNLTIFLLLLSYKQYKLCIVYTLNSGSASDNLNYCKNLSVRLEILPIVHLPGQAERKKVHISGLTVLLASVLLLQV